MYLLPSTSYAYAPFTRSKTMGLPPTDLNARTGEFTPPGRRFFASVKIWLEHKTIAQSQRSAGHARKIP